MKIFAPFLFVLAALCTSCSTTPPPTVTSPQQQLNGQWYRLDQGNEHVTDFALPAGGSKPVEIISGEALFIGFKTDASAGVVKRYFKQQPQPVRLQVVGVNAFIGSVIGCGDDFPPVDGKLRFVAVNDTDVTLRLVIYKRKSTSTMIWPGVKKPDE